jgi:hypothetical protein
MAVSPAIYHVMKLVEFLQMAFFIFYKVTITNEFAPPTLVSTDIEANTSNQSVVLSPSDEYVD